MKFRTFLLGSAAVLLTAQGGFAADALVAAEAAPMEYVRVCDAYGEGYFFIPGTETCLNIGGYVRFDSAVGDDVFTGEFVRWQPLTRATLEIDARSETEYGTLRSFIEHRMEVTDGSDPNAFLISAYIELAGFRAGFARTHYETWTDSAGNVINDDVIDYAGTRTNQVSYVFDADNGFSALIGLDEGAGNYDTGDAGDPTASYKDGDAPHVIGGVKYEQDWGGVAAVAGYDTHADAFGGKLRVDVVFNDVFSGFAMVGYQSDWDNDKGPGGTRRLNYYGPWNGDWAAWGGLTAKLWEKTSINSQLAYEEDGTLAAALNLEYNISGLRVMPELNYTDFGGERGDDDAFGGTLRIQRNF